jgi:hypothetical protein
LVNEGKKAMVVSVAAKSLWFIARLKHFGGWNRRSAVEVIDDVVDFAWTAIG